MSIKTDSHGRNALQKSRASNAEKLEITVYRCAMNSVAIRCASAACTVWLLMILAVKGEGNQCRDPHNGKYFSCHGKLSTD